MNNLIKISFFAFYLCSFQLLHAQKSEKSNSNFFENKHEVGINCTKLLGNMLSLTTPSNNTPFGFLYAYHLPKYTFRASFDAQYNNDGNAGLGPIARNVIDHSFGARVGVERHYQLSPKFQMNYGIDIFGANSRSESIIQGQFLQAENMLKLGGGPALRVLYKLNPRINFMTESTLYGAVANKTKTLQDGTPVPSVTKSTTAEANLTLPFSFYIILLF